MSETHSYLDPVSVVDYTQNQSLQTVSQFIFSTVQKETRAILERLNGHSNVPVNVWNAFVFLIRAGELITLENLNALHPERYQGLCQRTFRALNNLYHPDTPTLSKSEDRALSALFTLDTNRFNRFLKNVDPERRDEARHFLSDLFYKACQSCAKELTLNTDFSDYVIDKKCPALTDLLLGYFKRDIDLFNTYMMANNPYLTDRYRLTKDEMWYGYDHILENATFAEQVRETIPPERWEDAIMMAIGCNAIHTDQTPAAMTAFIRKIERLPATRHRALLDLISAVFLETDATERARYSPKNLLPLLTQTTSPALQRQAVSFFNKLPVKMVQDMLDQPISDRAYALLLPLLSRTQSGRKRLLTMQTPTGDFLVWKLYEKSCVPTDMMGQLLNTAIDTQNTDFLQARKDVKLTPDFPAYRNLCTYFKNTVQALRFMTGFKKLSQTPDQQFQCLSDFIPDFKMRIPAAYMLGLVTEWARCNQSDSILSFFFEGDTKNLCRLTPKMTTEQMARFLTRPDETGRTAWHYFCLNRDRTFFSRVFKELHPSFLATCTRPDKAGMTPLSLMKGDLKFCQSVTEKIPALAPRLTPAVPVSHTPAISFRLPEKPALQPMPIPSVVRAPEKHPVAHWHICECRHDKNRRDPIYQALIQDEVDRLPPPQSQATNMASDQLEKKICLGTTVFKIWYNHRHWRIPFVMGHRTKTLYILPGSDRNDAYTNVAYCRIIRREVERIHLLEMERE